MRNIPYMVLGSLTWLKVDILLNHGVLGSLETLHPAPGLGLKICWG